jgi:ribosome-binding protein aMBF1 (putative translation factor)
MDPTVQQAREAHRKASSHTGLLHHYRRQRDELIRHAYAEGGYSYGSLARQIGCSPELIAKAVQGRT